MKQPLYQTRDTDKLGAWFGRHAQALHKGCLTTHIATACELAHRDVLIEDLSNLLFDVSNLFSRYQMSTESVQSKIDADVKILLSKIDRELEDLKGIYIAN